MDNSFNEKVYSLLFYIPSGKLTTYGALARQAGFPNHARHIGKLLSNLPKDSKLPWHRVVNSQGRLALSGESFERQRDLLAKEQVEVNENGKITAFKQHLID